MAALKNPKHEKFALLLFEGMPQNRAYEEAGYQFHEGNASRLRSSEKVCARLAELQAAAAKSSQVTVQSLLAELETARQRADNLQQLSAAVRAIKAKGRIAGIEKQRVEITNIDETFANCDEPEQIAAALAQCLAKDRNVVLTPKQQEEFIELTSQWLNIVSEFLAACRAKEIPQVIDVKAVQDHERRRLGLTRPAGSNGNSQRR
jgi:hypothetical protein